uniref:Programmed cell death protein 10 n=1 Tax=Globodera pallida TaxID=36090 RepID=A0A183BPY7_GLOPA
MHSNTIATNEEGAGYLSPWTYSCLIRVSVDRLKKALSENPEAVHALNHLQEVFRQVDRASPSFLYDFSKLLLTESGVAEFRYLSIRAIALCKVLARIPDEMADRRPFLETIKEIASSIKQLLDTTNAIIAIVPHCYQPLAEKRKREFVQVSKRFSSTLKEYFKHQEPNQVFVAANQLIVQTMKLCIAIRDRVHLV